MAKKKTLKNDDIDEKKRLELYNSQYLIRVAEQRAYDLFLENLVKGTSHLSLGQEAIAAGFATAMQENDKSFCTYSCLLYTSPSPRDATLSRMPSSA